MNLHMTASASPAVPLADHISRLVTLSKSFRPIDAIKATGYRQYIDKDVLSNIPRSPLHSEGELVFFNFGRRPDVPVDEVAAAYAERNLTPAPYRQIAYNQQIGLEFLHEYPNLCQWWDDRTKTFCYVAFCIWGGQPTVTVRSAEHRYPWHHAWWYAGVPN